MATTKHLKAVFAAGLLLAVAALASVWKRLDYALLPIPDMQKARASPSQPVLEKAKISLPPPAMPVTSRHLAVFASGLVFRIAAVAGAWMLLGSNSPPAPDKQLVSIVVPQPITRVARQLAACPLRPAAAVAGEQDGYFSLANDLSGLMAADGATFIAMGKEAAAAGRTRDAEVAFLMSCRIADKFKGSGSLESADAKYQLGLHYSKIALDTNSAARADRVELLRRAELLYSDSLHAYLDNYGQGQEKKPLPAHDRPKPLQQTLAQAENLQPAPMPQQLAQNGTLTKTNEFIELARQDAFSSSSPALDSKLHPRKAELAKTASYTPKTAPISGAVMRPKPSFDCPRALSMSEKMICSDAELSQLDRELGRIYARARNSTPDRAALARQQKHELRLRETLCRNRECLLHWYSQRRVQLMYVIEKRGQSQFTASRWGTFPDGIAAMYKGS